MTHHDPRQCDLFAAAAQSPHQRLTAFGQAPPLGPDDFANIVGQEIAKRALEIAAVANHSLQFFGQCAEIDTLIGAGHKIGARQCFHALEGGSALDLNVEVQPTCDFDLRCPPPAETTAEIAGRVGDAQAIRHSITLLEEPAAKLMDDAKSAMRFDDASELRIMAVARSIAALANRQTIGRIHIAEALAYCRAPSPPTPPEPVPDAEIAPTGSTFDTEPAPPPMVDDDDAQVIAAERLRLFDVCTRGHETVAVDPKRLDKGGDIDRSYSADTLCNDGKLRSSFRLNGAEWVNTGGLWWRGDRYCDCYRVVPLEAFDGPSAPYGEHDWDRTRDSELGGYHGMRAKQGSRDVVLQGPKIVIIAGQPDQSALL